ncbi:MAG TPA: hypothetical protein VIL74_12430 [Pyrinomonadaceae bacterium]
MAKFDSPLNNLKVASPCSQDWNAMVGDGRKRYCGECKLNVYNLSGMSRAEAESLIVSAEGRLCVRFYRRADGSVLTEDCPVGWARAKQRARAFATAFASLILAFFGAGLVAAFKKSERTVMGEMIPVSTPERRIDKNAADGNSNVKGKEEPVYVMGNIAPQPKQTPENQSTVGRIAAPNRSR